jgi:hypothetical protein
MNTTQRIQKPSMARAASLLAIMAMAITATPCSHAMMMIH